MRFGRERMLFHALCVLDEAAECARRGRVAPSAGLRLALAFLHVNGAQRGWIDQFWHAAVLQDAAGVDAVAFGRNQQITAAFNAIARQAGMENDPELGAALAKVRARGV